MPSPEPRATMPAGGAVAATRAPARPDAEPQWSIVVIARNEAATIAACLESVQRAFAGTSHEIIFVDSGSTDDTLTLARRFPVRIVSVPADWPKRPAVGRHIGWTLSRGRWILFLDGDCVFEAAWLTPAIAALETDPQLAAVAGASRGVLRSADGRETVVDQYPDAAYEAPDHLSGSAVYRRAALERVGGFNPFLRAHEEPELGARLRKAGFTLRRLRVPMTSHYPKERKETALELFRRVSRRYPVGLGQFVRYVVSHRLPVRHPWKTIERHLAFLALMGLGLVALARWALAGSSRELLAWSALMTAVFLAFAIRSRSLTKPAYYFLEWALTAPMVLYGLLLPPRGVDGFLPLSSSPPPADPSSPRRAGREALFGIVLMGVAVTVGLLACEAATRIFKPQLLFRYPKGMYENHPTRGYRLASNFRGEMSTPEYRTAIATNNLGMRRDGDVGPVPAPGTFRVLAIGDSFTMGVGVDYEATFLTIAERQLRARGVQVEILNAGVPGYGTREELDVLMHDAPALRPDLVLLCFFIGNDLWDNARESTLRVRDGDLVDGEPTGGTLPPIVRTFLARHSHLYHLLWPYQRLLFGNDERDRRGRREALSIFGPAEGDARPAWEATERYLREFLQLAESRRVPVAVVLLPDPLQVDRSQWQVAAEELALSPPMDALEIPNRRLTEIVAARGVPVLDLLPALRRHPAPATLYLPLDKHWTRDGNHVAAGELTLFLTERGLVPRAPQVAHGD